MVALAKTLQDAGLPFERLDLGGGLGIVYDSEAPPDITAYADMVAEVTRDLDAELVFEPGRSIAGNAGVLVTRVIHDKPGRTKRYVIVDGAMNDLLRPGPL